jgi:hypothetical protein
MDIYKCPKMENGESNMENASFVTINENYDNLAKKIIIGLL